MKKIKTYIFSTLILLLSINILHSRTFAYKDFVLGENKKNIMQILKRPIYSSCTIYYESNDRFFGELKVKSENSIKIKLNSYMEQEEILLVFNENLILFDIYSKKKYQDPRDYLDYRQSTIDQYGKPSDEQTLSNLKTISWISNKKNTAIYLIYDSANGNLILNLRDTNLNRKYDPLN